MMQYCPPIILVVRQTEHATLLYVVSNSNLFCTKFLFFFFEKENCTGNLPGCPDDTFQPSSFVCRPQHDGNTCDVPENCTGSSPNCPPDINEPNGTVCRPSKGDCDPEEMYDYIFIGLLLFFNFLIFFVHSGVTGQAQCAHRTLFSPQLLCADKQRAFVCQRVSVMARVWTVQL